MESVEYRNIIEAIAEPGDDFEFENLSGGLIHRTWKLLHPSATPVLLQRINTHVFPLPELLISNYKTLFDHYAARKPFFRMPELLPFRDGSFLHADEYGNFWRMFEFIPGATDFLSLTPELAGDVAGIFGDFLITFSDLDAGSLAITIPAFHDLGQRYDQYVYAKASSSNSVMQGAGHIIYELDARKMYVQMYRELTALTDFPLRVMHQDAKLSNVLFDKKGSACCIVDFDTAMPGYIFSDFGDIVRSAVAMNDESNTIENAVANNSFYESIYNAYVEKADGLLFSQEKKYLHFSGIVMTYMQALRFLTDHLSGNKYYRVNYPDQNLDRAKNQFILLKSLEQFLRSKYGFNQ